MNFRTYLTILLIGLFVTSCTTPEQLYQDNFYVFGTIVGVSIWGVPEERAHQAVNRVAHDFQTMHQRWHAWESSPLVKLNQAIAAGQTQLVQESSLLFLIKQAQLFARQSDGLFNPAIGQLIQLWGFHQSEFPKTPPPSPQAIATLVAQAPSMADLEITNNRVSSRNRAVQLDFGAIAKGYALDLAIEQFHQQDIQNAIVNAGGNLKAIGKRGNRPWQIGIRHPSGQGVLAAITVMGEESVVTSGNYERFREYNNQRYSHIIDPRNGMPVQDITSVTVIDPSGTRADAAATALTIAGLPDWHRIAKQMELRYVMLVDKTETVYMNPAMAKRVQFNPQQTLQVILSEPLW